MKAPLIALLVALARVVAAQEGAGVPAPNDLKVLADLGGEVTPDLAPANPGEPPTETLITALSEASAKGLHPAGLTAAPLLDDDGDTGAPAPVGKPLPGQKPGIAPGQPNNVAPGNKNLAAGNVPLPPAQTAKPTTTKLHSPLKSDADEGPNKAAILGAIAGAFAVIIIIVIFLVWFVRRRKQNKVAEEGEGEDNGEGEQEKDEDDEEEQQQDQEEEQAQAPALQSPTPAADDPEAIQPYTVPIYEQYTQPTVAQQIDPYGNYATYSMYPYTSRV